MGRDLPYQDSVLCLIRLFCIKTLCGVVWLQSCYLAHGRLGEHNRFLLAIPPSLSFFICMPPVEAVSRQKKEFHMQGKDGEVWVPSNMRIHRGHCAWFFQKVSVHLVTSTLKDLALLFEVPA